MYKEIEGDLIKLAKEGKFDVIAHGCNCFCTMKSGIAPQMVKAFGCDTFDLEQPGWYGRKEKLGRIDYKGCEKYFRPLCVINAYTQYNYGYEPGKVYLSYDALRSCMREINLEFCTEHIGLPLIGCGKAGGDWNEVKKIIQEELKDMNVTIVHYKK